MSVGTNGVAPARGVSSGDGVPPGGVARGVSSVAVGDGVAAERGVVTGEGDSPGAAVARGVVTTEGDSSGVAAASGVVRGVLPGRVSAGVVAGVVTAGVESGVTRGVTAGVVSGVSVLRGVRVRVAGVSPVCGVTRLAGGPAGVTAERGTLTSDGLSPGSGVTPGRCSCTSRARSAARRAPSVCPRSGLPAGVGEASVVEGVPVPAGVSAASCRRRIFWISPGESSLGPRGISVESCGVCRACAGDGSAWPGLTSWSVPLAGVAAPGARCGSVGVFSGSGVGLGMARRSRAGGVSSSSTRFVGRAS